MNHFLLFYSSRAKKHKLFLPFSITLIISFLAIASIIFAQQVFSQPAYIADNFFIELVENKADLTQGTAIFKIRNPTPINITIDSSKLTARTVLAQDATPTKSLQYYILKTFSYSENITDYSTICNPFQVNDVNGTNYTNSNCTHVVTGWHWRNYTKDEFVPLERETLKANETYTIKLVGTWAPKFGLNAREWFPKINVGVFDYEQSKWAWWNTSWDNRQNITINASLDGWINLVEKVYCNAANSTQPDCDDIRYVNSNNALLPSFLFNLTGDEAWFIVNVSQTTKNGNLTISRYYNNSAAVTGDDAPNSAYLIHGVRYNHTNTTRPIAGGGFSLDANSNQVTLGAGGVSDYNFLLRHKFNVSWRLEFWFDFDGAKGDMDVFMMNDIILNPCNLCRGYELYYSYVPADKGDLHRDDGAIRGTTTIDGTFSYDQNPHNLTLTRNSTGGFALYLDNTLKGTVVDTTYIQGWDRVAFWQADADTTKMNNLTLMAFGDRAEIYSYGSIETESPYVAEADARTSIENGIKDSLGTDAVIYTDQQIYARYLNSSQQLARFDKVTKYGNQIWAFNYVNGSLPFTNMQNITPAFYVKEFANETSTTSVRTSVSSFINQTKVS